MPYKVARILGRVKCSVVHEVARVVVAQPRQLSSDANTLARASAQGVRRRSGGGGGGGVRGGPTTRTSRRGTRRESCDAESRVLTEMQPWTRTRDENHTPTDCRGAAGHHDNKQRKLNCLCCKTDFYFLFFSPVEVRKYLRYSFLTTNQTHPYTHHTLSYSSSFLFLTFKSKPSCLIDG